MMVSLPLLIGYYFVLDMVLWIQYGSTSLKSAGVLIFKCLLQSKFYVLKSTLCTFVVCEWTYSHLVEYELTVISDCLPNSLRSILLTALKSGERHAYMGDSHHGKGKRKINLKLVLSKDPEISSNMVSAGKIWYEGVVSEC